MAVACVFAGHALANGIDPSVVAGQASFAAQGSTLNITNSPGTIINWQGFSIGAGETTNFVQQSATSSVLNRVIGADPSLILGTLSSNGQVFLINPSGILVGQGARIDVAGLVASTLNLSDQDFLAGRLNFTSNPLAGNVDNQGSITTPTGGRVYLVGTNASNSGIINSPQGDVILAAGQSVNIFDTSTPGVRVEITASNNAAVNLGQILAQSGEVGIYGAALSNSGIINADQVVKDASGKIVLRAKQDVTLEAGSRISANGEQGGAITVQSDAGTTLVSGAVEAKGTQGEGGTIKILGNQVGLMDNASVNASGQTGGGTVLIGGDFHGANSNVQNATATYVGPDATIKADAIQSGNGGNVAVWADNTTRYYGNISARGGANSGDGGFVEVSGKHYLDFLGVVNTLAPAGKAGTLLLDPSDITISAGSDSGMSGTASPFSGTADTSILNVTTLTNALALGNVLVDASAGAAAGTGNITVSTVITWSTAKTLELKAGNDVLVSAAFNADTAGAAIKLTAGHDVTVNGALNAHGAGSAITLSAGNNVNVNAALVAPGALSAIELRAGNDGTGAGTVIFGSGGSANAPTTNIYYNPTLYANYDTDKTAYGAFITGGIGALNTYMLLYVTGLSADKTYNGNFTAVLTGTATITPASSDTVTLAGSGSVADFSNKDVHTEILSLTNNYSITGTEAYKYSLFKPSNLSASITAKTVTLSAAKTYDGTTDLTGAVTLATGISGEALTYSGATANDAHVPTANKYVNAITLLDGTGLASNYALPTLDVANAPVTINKAALAVTANAVTKTYDGGLTATGTGTVGVIAGAGDVVNSAGSQTFLDKNFGLGNKVVRASGVTLKDAGNADMSGNYTISYTDNTTSTINKAALAVTANPQSKVYGTIDPALTYTTGAFQFGDTAGSVLTGVLSRAAGEDVNSYAIGQNTLASNANYTIAYTGNNLAITPAALNVVANPQNKLFGTIDPALTFSVTGLVNNPALGIADTAGSVLSGALTRLPGESALGGPYAITQGSLAVNSSNYTLSSFAGNNLTITGAAAEPILGFNAGQVVFAGVINTESYYRPGNFWHISLNPNNADPGFDVIRGTNDLSSRLRRRLNICEGIAEGGVCETY